MKDGVEASIKVRKCSSPANTAVRYNFRLHEIASVFTLVKNGCGFIWAKVIQLCLLG